MKAQFLTLLSVTILMSSAWAQKPVSPSDADQKKPVIPNGRPSMFMVSLSYAGQFPIGDMAKRFYSNNNFGGQLGFITPSNWIFAAEIETIFSEGAKEDVLSNLRNEYGLITDQNGQLREIGLSERGWYLGGSVNKLIPLFKKNPRSGIQIGIGAGFFEHKIRINETSGEVTQLSKDMQPGYDRLSNGFALRQFVGYRHFSRKRLANFFLGVDLTTGFTKGRRGWQYDLQRRDDASRIDILLGLRVGWTLPIEVYNTKTERIYYY